MSPQPRKLTGWIIFAFILVIIGCLAGVVYKAHLDQQKTSLISNGNTVAPMPVVAKISGFTVEAPPRAAVGEEITVTISARGSDGELLAGYTGLVTIKSQLVPLPQSVRFFPGDVGRHQLKSRPVAKGVEIIEVADPAIEIQAKSTPITIE